VSESNFPKIPALTAAEFDEFPVAVHGRVCDVFVANVDASSMLIEGLALSSLPSIALSDRQTLPFVWVYVQRAMRMWEVEPMLNARLIVSDVLQGQVYALPLLMPNGKRWSPAAFASKKGPPPEGEALGGSTCTAESGKLPEHAPGRYAMTATVYDWKSNTVVADVTAQPGALEPPAPVPLEVAQQRMATLNRLVASGQVEFSGAALDAPPLAGQGLAVRIVSRDKKATLYGRLRVAPAEGAQVVPHSDTGVANGFAWVTLMLVKLDELDVVSRAVQVPLSTDGTSLVGQFAVHLDAVFDVELAGRLLYVVAGRYIEGALPIVAG
jgi:hypothetical protein